ncbi:aminoglycoside phosphotransferase family protein [Arthrobacter rhombi]|uniref:aminoglycoside phosphotransferase family protein n=1 Tax=Arthrobacter rhombi TaxID=71253 RepID=UPI003FD03D93
MQPGWSDAEQAGALGRHAETLMAQIWADRFEARVVDTARQVQFQLRPGAGASAVYSLRRGTTEQFVGLSTEPLEATPGLRQSHLPAPQDTAEAKGPLRISSWLHPQDPRLPGLARAGVAAEAQRLWGQGDRLTGLRTMTYRPLRRAVFRADFSTPGPVVATRRLYLKVLRPGQAEPLALRHRLLADAGLPVADVISPVAHSVVATAGLPGEPLGAALRLDGAGGLEPATLVSLLDRLPAAVLELPRRPSWTDRLARYAHAAGCALPEDVQQIAALSRHLREVIDAQDPGPVVPVHGDFYEANVLMEGRTVSGLLDLDSVGPGHRVDDLACLLGHLGMIPALGGRNRQRESAIWSTLEIWGAEFSREVDARCLYARAAAVAVSLIAGARRPGMRTWDREARARLEVARRLAELAG